MELLYEKEHAVNELIKKYMDILRGRRDFTLGYALMLGFSNIYIRLDDGTSVGVGCLYKNEHNFEYSGNLADDQLSTPVVVDEFYFDSGDFYGERWTVLAVRCKFTADEAKFKGGE